MGAFMMDTCYVAAGIAQFLGVVVAPCASMPHDITEPLQTLPIYTSLFNRRGMTALVCALIAITVLPPIIWLIAKHGAEAAIKRSAAARGTPLIAVDEQSG